MSNASGGNRIAVLGLYRSGSTAVAGALHHLGADMGAPFYHQYFESAELSLALRSWWDEPRLQERTPSSRRVAALRRWACQRERSGSRWIGAKHPLLSLCGDDLLQSWGSGTRFIWCHRPFEDSVTSLEQAGWWQDCRSIQRKLWTELDRFFGTQEHLRIDYAELMADRAAQVARLVDFLGMQPTPEQQAAAVRFVVPNVKAKVESARRLRRLLDPIAYMQRRIKSA
jgi:hypothetical protein